MNKVFTLLFITLISVSAFGQAGLKINEVDYDQQSTDYTEFLELFNSSANAIDLGNYSIVLINGNGGNAVPYDTITLPSQLLSPNGFFVICDDTGLVANCDLLLPTFTIQNGGNAAMPAPDAIAIVETSTLTLVDVLSYEGTTSSGFAEGTGVDPGQSDTMVSTPALIGMGRYPDGQDSNDNSADFHSACSSPGAANVNINTNCATDVNNLHTETRMVRVYPNPSKGISTIDCRGMKNPSITVKNVLGTQIKSISLNGQETYQCDLSELPNGVYFVQIKSDAAEYTQRVILRK